MELTKLKGKKASKHGSLYHKFMFGLWYIFGHTYLCLPMSAIFVFSINLVTLFLYAVSVNTKIKYLDEWVFKIVLFESIVLTLILFLFFVLKGRKKAAHYKMKLNPSSYIFSFAFIIPIITFLLFISIPIFINWYDHY
jgi:hypothetical protein